MWCYVLTYWNVSSDICIFYFSLCCFICILLFCVNFVWGSDLRTATAVAFCPCIPDYVLGRDAEINGTETCVQFRICKRLFSLADCKAFVQISIIRNVFIFKRLWSRATSTSYFTYTYHKTSWNHCYRTCLLWTNTGKDKQIERLGQWILSLTLFKYKKENRPFSLMVERLKVHAFKYNLNDCLERSKPLAISWKILFGNKSVLTVSHPE